MSTSGPTFFEKANNWIRQSVSIRLITIGILILLLLIPVSMIESLIYEREARQEEAIREVSSKWGEHQTFTGLVLTIPFKTYTKVFDGEQSDKFKLIESVEFAHFLPDQLLINGTVFPEKRYRGIYEVIVYNSKIKVSGNFLKPDFSEWNIDEENILWNDATVSMGLSDLRSIQENIVLKWDNQTINFNPGTESKDVIENGISARLLMNDSIAFAEKYQFDVDLNINGSSGINFIPLGKVTEVKINSDWKNPKFDGAFLPDNRTVNADGFSADWKVLHLNRPYPQKFTGALQGVQESAFGVNLIVPVDEYQKSMRSAKYAALFITLTFLIFFFVQIMNGVRIHPIQYIFVGLGLCVFYTLLIALSEHISFQLSYIISSVAIIGLITLYAKTIIKKKRLTLLVCLILTILYIFIYSIIQMEDYALLMGSVGLFIVLAIVMYLSRKINWYDVNAGKK